MSFFVNHIGHKEEFFRIAIRTLGNGVADIDADLEETFSHRIVFAFGRKPPIAHSLREETNRAAQGRSYASERRDSRTARRGYLR